MALKREGDHIYDGAGVTYTSVAGKTTLHFAKPGKMLPSPADEWAELKRRQDELLVKQAQLSKLADRLMWWIRAYLVVLVAYAIIVVASVLVRVFGG